MARVVCAGPSPPMLRPTSSERLNVSVAVWRFDCLRRARVRDDAADLVIERSGLARIVGRKMARSERLGRLISPGLPRGHWGRVRRKVNRLEVRSHRQLGRTAVNTTEVDGGQQISPPTGREVCAAASAACQPHGGGTTR